MKSTIIKKIILFVTICYFPLQSMGWGANGHRICGQIADSYLNAKARIAIKAILGNESVAISSTWADFIKSDPAYSYLSSWHYINFDKAYTYQEMQEYLKKDTATDAYTKLNFLIAWLKNKRTTKANKLLYLHMLIHIAEDVHQPFHTGHTADKGCNDFTVLWQGKDTNMHSLWDSLLIESQQLSYTEYAAWINHTTASQRALLQKEPISKWLYDSNQLAEKFYRDVKTGDNLGYRYNFTHIGVLNQLLLKAGVHLAGLLNSIFG